MREPASFWQENVIAVVILLRVLARMSWWWKQVIKCKKFYHFAIWGGLWCPFLKGVPLNIISTASVSAKKISVLKVTRQFCRDIC